MLRRRVLVSALACSVAAVAWACGSDGNVVFFEGFPDASPADAGAQSTFPRLEGGSDGSPCVNLECAQVTCPVGSAAESTTIRGRVYDPRGVNPLYNVQVYIPNAKLDDIEDGAGVTCDRCGGAFVSGSPLVADASKADGSFELTNVPAGVDLPVVVQVGKWRRAFTLPKVEACKVTEVTDPQVFRLPKNRGEGHIPRMAIAVGGADPFECLLRKIGIEDAEFTLPTGPGRVRMYRAYQYSGNSATEAAYRLGPGEDQRFPTVDTLWGDVAALKQADVTLLPCEGSPVNADKDRFETRLRQTQATYDNMKAYLEAGGRAFLTHYSKTVIEGHRADQSGPIDIPSHWGAVGKFQYENHDRSDARVITNAGGASIGSCLEPPVGTCPENGTVSANDTLQTELDTRFPKGNAFARWLVATNASETYGTLPVTEWRHNVESVDPAFGQLWIRADTRTAWPDGRGEEVHAGNVVQHLTFNTPLDAGVDDAGASLACGKVVFSDFHVAELVRDRTKHFPLSCGNAAEPMTPQEKALEFMLFDLSACIQDDRVEPPTGPK